MRLYQSFKISFRIKENVLGSILELLETKKSPHCALQTFHVHPSNGLVDLFKKMLDVLGIEGHMVDTSYIPAPTIEVTVTTISSFVDIALHTMTGNMEIHNWIDDENTGQVVALDAAQLEDFMEKFPDEEVNSKIRYFQDLFGSEFEIYYQGEQ